MQSFEQAVEYLWKDFGLEKNPGLPKIEVTDAILTCNTFLHDKLYVTKMPKAFNFMVPGSCAGKYLHSLVNPEVYSIETYLENYMDLQKLSDVIDLVTPATYMRSIVGLMSGIMFTLNFNDKYKKEKVIKNAHLFYKNLKLGFDVSPYNDHEKAEFIKYQVNIEERSTPVAAVFSCIDHEPPVSLAEIARADASEYKKYIEKAEQWLDTIPQRN